MPYNPGISYNMDQSIRASTANNVNAAIAIAQGLSGWLEKREERSKQLDAGAKAAEQYRKSLPEEEAAKLGSDDEWKHGLTTQEKISRMQGHGAATKENQERDKTLAMISNYNALTKQHEASADQRTRADRDAEVMSGVMQRGSTAPGVTTGSPMLAQPLFNYGAAMDYHTTPGQPKFDTRALVLDYLKAGGTMEGLNRSAPTLKALGGYGEDDKNFRFDPASMVQPIPQIPGMFYGQSSKGGGQFLSTPEHIGEIAKAKAEAKPPKEMGFPAGSIISTVNGIKVVFGPPDEETGERPILKTIGAERVDPGAAFMDYLHGGSKTNAPAAAPQKNTTQSGKYKVTW